MKEVILDCAVLTDRETLHQILERELGFPSWYGRNLDALYDCLTEVHEPVQITLQNLDSLMNYGKKLLRVLQDAAVENENIHVLIEEAAD